jgi:hypothetical protein
VTIPGCYAAKLNYLHHHSFLSEVVNVKPEGNDYLKEILFIKVILSGKD